MSTRWLHLAKSPAIATAGAIIVGWLSGCAGADRQTDRRSSSPSGATDQSQAGDLSVGQLLSGADTRGFARALVPTELSFPRDHGPHPGFRSEWWYLTGILRARASDSGRPRRFGYQFTIFRQALAPEVAIRSSSWSTRDVYLGHLAVSDIDGDPRARRFFAWQRFSRDGMALAGARGQPFEVWVESWRMTGPRSGADIFPLALQVREEVWEAVGQAQLQGSDQERAGQPPVTLELSLGAGRGPVLQGDRGLSVKGRGPGNASFYYSCTRLPTTGRLTLGQQTFEVEGASWFDREWSTSALDPDVVGWDWLGAELDDGRDLMVYRLRTMDGRAAPASRATLIAPDGTTRIFAPDAFSLVPQGRWESPDHRAHYPAGFGMSIPSADLDVTIRPLLADQELLLGVRYWEGAVALTGAAAGHPLQGQGYLELTGYFGSAPALGK